MSVKDGGPAFPSARLEKIQYSDPRFAELGTTYGEVTYSGLSLRDYFAGQALAGWIANGAVARVIEANQVSPSGAQIVLVAGCYQIADAMLKERAK
jgi:hypothetical protein